jgi:hypothetical protein
MKLLNNMTVAGHRSANGAGASVFENLGAGGALASG